MKEIREAFSLYLRLIGVQIRSQMMYRFSFWMDILSTASLSGAYILGIFLIFQRFPEIQGWTLSDVAFLLGMAEMAFATMDLIFSGFDPDVFTFMIQNGGFDQLLLRPVDITLQVLGSQFTMRRLGRILEGAIVIGIAFSISPIEWTLGKLLYLPVVFISLVMGMGAMFVAGGTLIFWTVQPMEAVNILTYGGSEMMSYPMHIYPPVLRGVFTYVIPFIFLNYYPGIYLLGKPDPLGFPPFAPFLAPFVGAGMLLLALRFWQFGVRSYQSTGT